MLCYCIALAFNPLVSSQQTRALVPHFNTTTDRRGLQLDDTCHLIWEPFPAGFGASCDGHAPVCRMVGNCEPQVNHDPVTYQPIFENPCAAELGEAKQCRHLEFRHFNSTVDPTDSTVTMRFKLWDATNDAPVPDLAACKFEVLAGDNYRA